MLPGFPEQAQLIQGRLNPTDNIRVFLQDNREKPLRITVKCIRRIVRLLIPGEKILLDVALIRERFIKPDLAVLLYIFHKFAEQNEVLLNDMDILRLPVHVFVNLFTNVGNDERSITADNSSLVLLIARDLAEILFNHVNNKVSIVIGQLADGVQKHTRQRIHGIVDF